MNDDPNYREVEIMGLSELVRLQRRVLRRIKHLKEIEGLPAERAGKETLVAKPHNVAVEPDQHGKKQVQTQSPE